MASTMMSLNAGPISSVSARKSFAGASLPAAPLALPMRRAALQTQALFTKDKKQNIKGGKPQRGYDADAPRVDPLQPAFTRRRELFVGRLAQLGFASAIIGELFTGKGALGQLQLELGLPSYGADLLVFGFIAYSTLGALRPGSPTFSEENQRDIKKRPKGPPQDGKLSPLTNPKQYFGTTEYGFSKRNEIFVGRVAQLGFLAAIIGEKVTGKGPLAQVGIEAGVPSGLVGIGLIAFIGFFLVSAVFTGVYGDDAVNEDESY